jgi:hypothetical protein
MCHGGRGSDGRAAGSWTLSPAKPEGPPEAAARRRSALFSIARYAGSPYGGLVAPRLEAGGCESLRRLRQRGRTQNRPVSRGRQIRVLATDQLPVTKTGAFQSQNVGSTTHSAVHGGRVHEPKESVHGLCESVNRPVESVHRLWESVNRPVESIHRLWESVNRPVESIHRLWESVNRPVESIHGLWESVNRPVESVHGLWNCANSPVL